MDAIKAAQPVPHNYRCTFSLPQQLAKDISFIAKRLKLSQSALLALLLEEPIGQLAKLAAVVPADSSAPVAADTVRRLRGDGVDVLRAAVTQALAAAKDLDPGFEL
jgi:hypothetical protein